MIKKQREYAPDCKHCGSKGKIVQEEIHACDGCGKTEVPKGGQFKLTAIVMYKHEENNHLQFCSWKCAIKKLKTVKTDYCISLPYLHFNEEIKIGESAKDFFKLLK